MKKEFNLRLMLLSLVPLLLFSCGKDIEISDKKWRYSNQECVVEFFVKNNEYESKLRKIRITAYLRKDIGKGAIVNDIIGEKDISINLGPNENLRVEETIELLINKKPTIVTINQLKVK